MFVKAVFLHISKTKTQTPIALVYTAFSINPPATSVTMKIKPRSFLSMCVWKLYFYIYTHNTNTISKPVWSFIFFLPSGKVCGVAPAAAWKMTAGRGREKLFYQNKLWCEKASPPHGWYRKDSPVQYLSREPAGFALETTETTKYKVAQEEFWNKKNIINNCFIKSINKQTCITIISIIDLAESIDCIF